MIPGRASRASAIAAAGIVLSQPTITATASRQWPLTASSMESAITSREISEARMPGVPIAIPSVTEMVLKRKGVPPAERIASASGTASVSRWMLQGVTSVQQVTIPM